MAATATEQWKCNTLSKASDAWRATRSFIVIFAAWACVGGTGVRG